jgi:hypothetical protein
MGGSSKNLAAPLFFWNVASPAPLKSLVLRQYNRELRGKATKPSLPTCLSLIVLDYSVLQPENAHFTDYIDEIDTEGRTRRKGDALPMALSPIALKKALIIWKWQCNSHMRPYP